jgi:protein-tyrosine phosphatase
LIATVVFVVLLLVSALARIAEIHREKRRADARRRTSMREVTERWHFREWEQEFRSSDWR